MKVGTSGNSLSEATLEMPEAPENFQDTAISDDPELAAMIRDANASLEAEGVPRTNAAPIEPAPIDFTKELSAISESTELTDEFDVTQVEINPATTLVEFSNNVALAELHGVKIIEASKAIIMHFCKPHYPAAGFFHYKGVMVIETGRLKEVEQLLNQKMEDKLFGHSKVK